MREKIIQILKSYPNNITAQRWLKNEKAIQAISTCAEAWNKDHEIMGYPDMIYPIETHVEIYLDTPEIIEYYANNDSLPH